MKSLAPLRIDLPLEVDATRDVVPMGTLGRGDWWVYIGRWQGRSRCHPCFGSRSTDCDPDLVRWPVGDWGRNVG